MIGALSLLLMAIGVLTGALAVVLLKKGELSVLYPIVATSYVWVSILAPFFFPTESMNSWKWMGVLLILFSICFAAH